jgi:Leucine-rich repeat (LRR) protein
MLKPLLLSVALLLAGCSTPVPLTQKFPDAPPELMKNCDNLNTLDESKNKITDLLKVVVENYKLYYECANRVEGWKLWHSTQKELFDNPKQK